MEVCPLCGNKLQRGYCSQCGGNITNVCDADEPLEVHEHHASVMPGYSSPEEKSSFSKELNQKAFQDAKSAYDGGYSAPGSAYRKATAESNKKARVKGNAFIKVFMILITLGAPFMGIFAGIVMIASAKKNSEWNKFGIVLLIVGIIFFFPFVLIT